MRAAAPPKPLVYRPPAGAPRVLHEDAEVIAVSKPAGLLSVPGKPADCADCLESRVRDRYPEALTVHRLDMDTSGVVVLARNPRAHRNLSMQFARRHVAKTYVARVHGAPGAESGEVDLPLRADWPNRPRQMVDREHGRPALTRWEVIAREGAATRLRLSPVTGRSHQLRVHLLSLGCPILGDPLYADGAARAAAPRLQLHAETLTIRHPADGRSVAFADPCPF